MVKILVWRDKKNVLSNMAEHTGDILTNIAFFKSEKDTRRTIVSKKKFFFSKTQ